MIDDPTMLGEPGAKVAPLAIEIGNADGIAPGASVLPVPTATLAVPEIEPSTSNVAPFATVVAPL